MRVFLTGGTGFIGQQLVVEMSKRGWDVTVLVRDPTNATARWIANRGCKLSIGDITHSNSLSSAIRGMDAVIHNAGMYELGATTAQKERMQQVNVQGTENVLAAAFEARVPRSIYISSTVALGASGYPPTKSVPKNENNEHDGFHSTPYNRSKYEAHRVAEKWQKKGLPLSIAMPNAVVGANDHSVIGYFLRLHLLKAMPPVSFGGDAVISFVDVNALSNGICLVVEKGTMGESYLFSGEPQTLKSLFQRFGQYSGSMKVRLWLPRWFMRPQMYPLEPIQRKLGLPAFLSREVVDQSRIHLNYTATKAKSGLGWTHPSADVMWNQIIEQEQLLVKRRSGFLNRLRHESVVIDEI